MVQEEEEEELPEEPEAPAEEKEEVAPEKPVDKPLLAVQTPPADKIFIDGSSSFRNIMRD